MPEVKTIKLGLLGCGTVGCGVYDLVQRNRAHIAERFGVQFDVSRILVRDVEKPRQTDVPRSKLTTDAYAIVDDPAIQVVVEVMGGVTDAYEYVRRALAQGKHVVTANKDMMATYGQELHECADDAGASLRFEASVGGGIPIIQSMLVGLGANRITRVSGILNGTTNYILTRMQKTGCSFDEALDETRRLGYAEADPTADIEGWDAARKLVIVSKLGFGAAPRLEEVRRRGITALRSDDFVAARALGCTIKLVAGAERLPGCQDHFAAWVTPMLVASTQLLARVEGVTNAVVLEGDPVGQLLLAGPGAGSGATASAIGGDLLELIVSGKVDDRQRNGWPAGVKPVPSRTARSPMLTARWDGFDATRWPYLIRVNGKLQAPQTEFSAGESRRVDTLVEQWASNQQEVRVKHLGGEKSVGYLVDSTSPGLALQLEEHLENQGFSGHALPIWGGIAELELHLSRARRAS